MNHKKILLGLIVVSIIALGVGYVLSEPLKFGICESTYSYVENGPAVGCTESFGENIPEPLLWAFLSLLFITIPIFFVRREVFLAWAKFAGVAFPLMLGVLLYTYNNESESGGFNPMGALTDEYLATFLLPPLFLIISLFIIGIKSWKLKHSK